MPCIWLCYADSHALDTYEVFNPTTCKVILRTDVTFMKKLHFCEEKEVKENELTEEKIRSNKIRSNDYNEEIIDDEETTTEN